MYVHAYVRVSVRVCVRVCARVCVSMCARVQTYVFEYAVYNTKPHVYSLAAYRGHLQWKSTLRTHSLTINPYIHHIPTV